MAKINEHVCRSGALMDFDDLALELIARTQLHNFLHQNRLRSLSYIIRGVIQ